MSIAGSVGQSAESASSDASSRLEALLERSAAQKLVGNHREGAEHARQAADLAQLLRDDPRRIAAWRLEAIHLFRLGSFEDAIRICQHALHLAQQHGDEGGASDALGVMAVSYSEIGLHDEALKSVTDSLDSAQRVGDKTLLFWAYNRVGSVHDELMKPAEAHQFLVRALALARELNGQEERFAALNNLSGNAINLAKLHSEHGEDEAAKSAIRRGLDYAEEGVLEARASNNGHRESICLGNYGMLLGLAGDYDAAFRVLRQSEEIARANGYRPVEMAAVQSIAELLRVRGDTAEALARFNEVLQAAGAHVEKSVLLQIHMQLSKAYKQLGQFREALEQYERFHEIERQMYSEQVETRARMLMNRLELDNAKIETEVQRLRSAELEAQKHDLEARTVELDRRVHEDQLTGLWNRRQVDAEFPRLLAHASARAMPFSVAMADVDHFKAINDRYGHMTGDEVLKRIAFLLKSHCRPADVVARYGGEEFVMLLVDTALDAAVVICERLREAIQTHPWHELNPSLYVTISIGICDNVKSDDHRELLSCADAQLYEAKHLGRNRVEPGGAPHRA